MSALDSIELRGIRAYGRHGADPGERDHAQAFDIDMLVELDLHAARATDELAETVDYAALHARIVGIVSGESYRLLERLGERILEDAMRDERVMRAEVTLAKPKLLAGATPLVTLRRSRG